MVVAHDRWLTLFQTPFQRYCTVSQFENVHQVRKLSPKQGLVLVEMPGPYRWEYSYDVLENYFCDHVLSYLLVVLRLQQDYLD